MDPDEHKVIPLSRAVRPGSALQKGIESSQVMGMAIFLCAWLMLFVGLLMAYGVIRSSATSWPPPGTPKLPVALAGANTGLVLVGSGAYAWGRRALAVGARARSVQLFFGALVAGAMFLAMQAAMWASLSDRGLTLDQGSYAGIFYVLTGFHGLHLGVGELALGWIVWHVWRGTLNPARMQPVRLWGYYWHSVSAVWCATYVAVYLL